MKQFTLFVTLCFCTIYNAYSQENTESLFTTFTKYSEALESQDYIKALSFIDDDFYNFESEDRILDRLNRMKNDKNTIVENRNYQLIELQDSLVYKNKAYSFIRYSYDMTMKFTSSTDGFNASAYTVNLMKQKYGESNVMYNRKKHLLIVHVETTLYAIKKEMLGWKFIENKNNYKESIEQIIPKKIRKRWKE